MHPEADALLNAIWDNPDDDTPRLVYADWLQEHDQEDYAQFIRMSIEAVRGAKSFADRTRLEAERFPLWQRIMAPRVEAVGTLPIRIDQYRCGLCTQVVIGADDFVRTAATWWPAITPSGLRVFGVNGRERQVIGAVQEHLPWIRELRCDNHRSAIDNDAEWNAPLSGELLAAIAAPGYLPRLEDLAAVGVSLDYAALDALAGSDLALRLKRFQAWVCSPAHAFRRFIGAEDRWRPDAIRAAIREFIDEYSAIE